jgi:hypothetical protein
VPEGLVVALAQMTEPAFSQSYFGGQGADPRPII